MWIDVTDPIQVAPWGVFVSVPEASASSVKISIQATLLNQMATVQSATIVTTVLDPAGHESVEPNPPASCLPRAHEK